MNIFLREKTNPNFDKPSEEDISQEIKANELRVGDTIITENVMAMGDEKYIGRIDEIDEAKRHIVVALTDVGAIKTKRIRKKVTSLLLGVWNINNGEEKEIVIYTKYDEGGKSTMALEKEETVKKISDTKVLEQCIDPEYYNY